MQPFNLKKNSLVATYNLTKSCVFISRDPAQVTVETPCASDFFGVQCQT
jgi:hypothetical protein